jgi:hypothetical protein
VGAGAVPAFSGDEKLGRGRTAGAALTPEEALAEVRSTNRP